MEQIDYESDNDEVDGIHLLPKILPHQLQQRFIHLSKQSIIENANQVVEMIKSENIYQLYNGIHILRKWLGQESDQQFQQTMNLITQFELCQNIIHIIESSHNQLLIYEALWVITNISSGSAQITQQLIENNCLQQVINKFKPTIYNEKIIEMCIWIFGNLAGDNQLYADQLLRMGTLQLMVDFANTINQNQNQNLHNLVIWSISNYFTQIQLPIHQHLISSLKFLIDKLRQKMQQEPQQCICAALEKSAETKDSRVLQIISENIRISEFIKLTESRQVEIQTSSLNTIIYLAEGESQFSQKLCSSGIIQSINRLFTSKVTKQQQIFMKIFQLLNIIGENINIKQIQLLFDINLMDNAIRFIITNNEIVLNFALSFFSNVLQKIQTCDEINISFEQIYNFYTTAMNANYSTLKQIESIQKISMFYSLYLEREQRFGDEQKLQFYNLKKQLEEKIAKK